MPNVKRKKPAGRRRSTSPKPKPATRRTSPRRAAPRAPAKGKTVEDKASGVGEGNRAPSFSLPDQAGRVVSSSSLAGKPYVLYFYPKDDTSGCTREACGFRDSLRGFGAKGVKIIGVSPDNEASHARFAGKYGLPFTLLADTDKSLARAYGVWAKKQNYGREYMGIVRSTFLVDKRGVVKKAWRGVRVDGHIDAVLAAAGEL
ncbi:MAG TPA: peroxiredoxin [Polyangiaceae bacterium]|nr:peroxiredoxin [Polyangiaceae bacterium]